MPHCSLVVIGDNDAPLAGRAFGTMRWTATLLCGWIHIPAPPGRRKDQCHGPPGTAVRWRQNLAGDANARENFRGFGRRIARTSISRCATSADLADYLTWRSTGDEARSVCTVTCKWTYLAHEQRWDAGYFRQIGLAELADEDFCPHRPADCRSRHPCGEGLCATAAEEMGLPIQHAGGGGDD